MSADSPIWAPDFPSGLEWVNVDAPLSIGHELAGHAVLVAFWRATSVHSLHVLQTLEYLDQRFLGRPLTIVGVHSPRFAAERDADWVRRAVSRLRIRHPVAVDTDRAAWDAFGVQAWPTLVLIDPAGTIRFQGAGETNRDRLAVAVEMLVEEAEVGLPPEIGRCWPDRPTGAPPPTRLRSPAGLAVDPAAGLLWIADTGHHRLLAVDLDSAELRHTIGSGRCGGVDGDCSSASLHDPRGIAVSGDNVYVADAGNHGVRVADLGSHELRTMIGQGRVVHDHVGGLSGDAQGIASPWGVAGDESRLFVAQSGLHQIWSIDLHDDSGTALAGTGTSGLVDGVSYDAELNQPTDVALYDDVLLFVDSESGAVRRLELHGDLVTTLIGGNSKVAGDVDGTWDDARMQSPRAIAFCEDGGACVVADTLNDKIKRLDLERESVETLLGPEDGLSGPEAVAVHDETMFVADTGNDRVLRVNLTTREVAPLEIVDPHPEHHELAIEPVQLRARAEVKLCFPIPSSAGSYPHPDVRARAFLRNAGGAVLLRDVDLPIDREGEWGVVAGIPTGEPGSGTIEMLVCSTTCEDMDGVCHVHESVARIDVELNADGPDVIDVPLT